MSEIGDILICRNVCVMQYTNQKTTTVGKEYQIVDIGENDDGTHLIIIDDYNEEHLFPIDEFHPWFYDKKSLLNKKLKKIKCINSVK
jgi:hypothetical protein